MQELIEVKAKIAGMSRLALAMWQMTFKSFMEHDLDTLSKVLDDENKLNDLEKEITQDLVTVGRASRNKEEREAVSSYTETIGDLELIGDYCKDILERVQIKIEERLLFSDEAVKDYDELYHKTEKAFEGVAEALEKDDAAPAKKVVKDNVQIGALVDELRARHTQRLMDGICDPRSCNMFLNMLDFTSAVYQHIEKLAARLAKMKRG